MADEPMPDGPMNEETLYDQWMADRRSLKPLPGLTDRVMAAVEQQVDQRRSQVRLADWMNESWTARWAACLAAMLVGGLPFLVVAYMALLIVF